MLKYAEELERVAGGASERASRAATPARGAAGPSDRAVAPGGPADLAGVPQAKPREAVVATEIGMLHPLRMAAPDVSFIPANAEASCKYMKMITLPKLRDALREIKYEVRVDPETAAKARVPIDRMVAIG
jgi:quinolinate synthase